MNSYIYQKYTELCNKYHFTAIPELGNWRQHMKQIQETIKIYNNSIKPTY